jgi:hypothetical protein
MLPPCCPPPLQELDVSHSPCTASGLGGLTALTHSLRVLHLRGCQVGVVVLGGGGVER